MNTLIRCLSMSCALAVAVVACGEDRPSSGNPPPVQTGPTAPPPTSSPDDTLGFPPERLCEAAPQDSAEITETGNEFATPAGVGGSIRQGRYVLQFMKAYGVPAV